MRDVILFFFNDPATTEIYTLSLHDALPIFAVVRAEVVHRLAEPVRIVLRAVEEEVLEEMREACLPASLVARADVIPDVDWKSTRLNSSHANISYAVFCLKKKNVTVEPQVRA